MFHSLRWRIAVPYLILILLAMGGLAVYLSHLVRQSHLSDLQEKLTAEAQLIGDAVETTAEWDGTESKLDALAQHYADLLDARVTSSALMAPCLVSPTRIARRWTTTCAVRRCKRPWTRARATPRG
jgi:hypothetical protein